MTDKEKAEVARKLLARRIEEFETQTAIDCPKSETREIVLAGEDLEGVLKMLEIINIPAEALELGLSRSYLSGICALDSFEELSPNRYKVKRERFSVDDHSINKFYEAIKLHNKRCADFIKENKEKYSEEELEGLYFGSEEVFGLMLTGTRYLLIGGIILLEKGVSKPLFDGDEITDRLIFGIYEVVDLILQEWEEVESS